MAVQVMTKNFLLRLRYNNFYNKQPKISAFIFIFFLSFWFINLSKFDENGKTQRMLLFFPVKKTTKRNYTRTQKWSEMYKDKIWNVFVKWERYSVKDISLESLTQENEKKYLSLHTLVKATHTHTRTQGIHMATSNTLANAQSILDSTRAFWHIQFISKGSLAVFCPSFTFNNDAT